MKDKTTIKVRMASDKAVLLEQLKKTPIVQIACEKVGVGRATYYRWRNEDTEFAKAANEALNEGSLLINDMAESQLIAAIRDRNLTAIIWWLRNHHPAYATRVEITAKTKQPEEEKLTPEQDELIRKALGMASLVPNREVEVEPKPNE